MISIEKCVGCGRCIGACNYDAIRPIDGNSSTILNERMSEYAYAVVKDRPNFHISLICDVSPYCDCHSENDVEIVPDIGMLASFDPVALDMAFADLVNKAPVNPGSRLDEMEHVHNDHFIDNHPSTNWISCLNHAEELGLDEMNTNL